MTLKWFLPKNHKLLQIETFVTIHDDLMTPRMRSNEVTSGFMMLDAQRGLSASLAACVLSGGCQWLCSLVLVGHDTRRATAWVHTLPTGLSHSLQDTPELFVPLVSRVAGYKLLFLGLLCFCILFINACSTSFSVNLLLEDTAELTPATSCNTQIRSSLWDPPP